MKKFIIISYIFIGIQNSYSQAQAAEGGSSGDRGIWIGFDDWGLCLPFDAYCKKAASISNFSWENEHFILIIDISTYAEDVQNYFKQNSKFVLNDLPQEGITFLLSDSIRTLSGKESFTFLNGSYLYTREENLIKIQF